VRVIVEGESAYTTVNGEKCTMSRGDLILTPSWQWHEHGHEGSKPVVWLDVLDLPLVYYLEASYAVEGTRQTVKPDHGEVVYAHGGVVPTVGFERDDRPYPMLRYPWSEARAALVALAKSRPDLAMVQVTYVNPETGRDTQNILGFYAQMLRPGQTLKLPVRSPAMVFHVIEGAVTVVIDDDNFSLAQADTCCAPGFVSVTLRNSSSRAPAFIFIADETPLHRKLGVFESRG
jgi:gentisate 1,2-dioxygenase